jgi:hypothetical protein
MIESATVRDLPEIRALLERMHLPLAGVDEDLPAVLVARDGGQIVGTAALELYANGALPRLSAQACYLRPSSGPASFASDRFIPRLQQRILVFSSRDEGCVG